MNLPPGYYWIRVKHFWEDAYDEPEIALLVIDGAPEWMRCGNEVGIEHNDLVTVLSAMIPHQYTETVK